MMIIVESVTGGTNFFKVTIPTDFAAYAADWSHYNIAHDSRYCGSSADLNDVQCSTVGCYTGANYGSFSGQFENGMEHTVKISAQSSATGRIGLVLEYAD